MPSFYANGKLLLTGEYAVLDGALALAIPCKYGQKMDVEMNTSEIIHWKSLDYQSNIWFEAKFTANFDFLTTSDTEIGTRLQSILQACRKKNPSFLSQGAEITTILDFPRAWGLGTSSTLVSLLAQFAQVDPFDLYFETFGGSGYDIACATASGPILYQIINNKPSIEYVYFKPPFLNQLYFVYLGKKQNSREGIKHYLGKKDINSSLISNISSITRQILMSQNKKSFSNLIEEHESIIADHLELPIVKTTYFPDFNGSIKSLGAWGGDFVLVISNISQKNTFEYFTKKGYDTIVSYDEMVLGL